MGFVTAHQAWLDKHVQSREGERKGRLERGHGHGERLFLEKVWWPLFGHFDHLHPEYEVADWRGQLLSILRGSSAKSVSSSRLKDTAPMSNEWIGNGTAGS